MRVDLVQFKKFLFDSRLISETAWDEAEEEATKRNLPVKDILVSNGTITEDDLRRIDDVLKETRLRLEKANKKK